MAAQIATVVEAFSKGVARIVWTWTSAADGTVVLTTDHSYFGVVLAMVTDPGATAPTDNYDVTITDSLGYDVLGGVGADRDTANTERVAPATTAPVFGPLQLNIANAGDAKTGVVVLYVLGEREPS